MESGPITFRFEVIWAINRYLRGLVEVERGGLLGGQGSLVEMAVEAPNAAGEPRDSYQLSPAHQAEGVRSLEEQGYELMGTFHSHPNRPAVMSGEDVATAEGTGLLLIVSIRDFEWGLYDPTRRGKEPVPIAILPPGDPFRRYSTRFT